MLLPDSVFSVVPDISRCYFQRTCNGALSQCRHSTLSSTTSQLWGSIYTDANYYLRELFASSFVRIHANTYSPWRATNLACECVVKLTRLVFPAAYAELQATIWGVGFIGGGSSLPKRGSWKTQSWSAVNTHWSQASDLNTIQFRSKRLDRINLHRGKSSTRNWRKRN